VTAFCEWTGEKKSKRKAWFELTDEPLFAFAGIWRPAEGERPRYAFLTTDPNETVGTVMPVLLSAETGSLGLEADWNEAKKLVSPFSQLSLLQAP
jgi:putative SOS response-associated peptidase YedK|tara:strand:+ start:3856 stop:4140 length:285 start_codon:yes stop_codon:yes gene_type:complete